MLTFLLVFHFIVTLLLIGLVLIQKHDGGGLSAGLSSAANGFMTSRGQANFLTKSTAILMAIFIVNCLVMAKIAKNSHTHVSIIDRTEQELSTPHDEFDQTRKNAFNRPVQQAKKIEDKSASTAKPGKNVGQESENAHANSVDAASKSPMGTEKSTVSK